MEMQTRGAEMSEETRKAALREFMAKREVEGRELGITSEYTFKSGWDAGASKIKLEIAEEIENHSYLALSGTHELCAWLDSLTKRLREEANGTVSGKDSESISDFMNTHAFQPGDPKQGWENQCSVIAPDGLRHCGGYRADHPMQAVLEEK